MAPSPIGSRAASGDGMPRSRATRRSASLRASKDALHRHMGKRIQSKGVEALRSPVLASRRDPQFANEEPFGRRRVHGPLHDFDQRSFIAARHRQGVWLDGNRTHNGPIMAQWVWQCYRARTNGFGVGTRHQGSSQYGRILTATPPFGADFQRPGTWFAKRPDSDRGWCWIRWMSFGILAPDSARTAAKALRSRIANWPAQVHCVTWCPPRTEER